MLEVTVDGWNDALPLTYGHIKLKMSFNTVTHWHYLPHDSWNDITPITYSLITLKISVNPVTHCPH